MIQYYLNFSIGWVLKIGNGTYHIISFQGLVELLQNTATKHKH